MSFSWLEMRITEEQDRRRKEAEILERLPLVLEEVNTALAPCVASYAAAFGEESIEIVFLAYKIKITLREERDGKWQKSGLVEITTMPTLPGIHIDRNGDPLDIEVGILPGNNSFFKDAEEFLTMEELTRRILDKALFPKLGE